MEAKINKLPQCFLIKYISRSLGLVRLFFPSLKAQSKCNGKNEQLSY